MLVYTCANCHRELRCLKNMVALVHFMNDRKEEGIDVVRYGDLWGCESCGCKVVIGLSLEQRLGIDLAEAEVKGIMNSEYIEVKRS